MSMVGFWGIFLNDTIAKKYNGPISMMKFPLEYGSSSTDEDSLLIQSINMKQTIHIDSEVDATGTVTLPGGTYKCVREKHIQITEIDVSGNKNYDSTYQYNFINKEEGWPILQIDVDKNDSITTIYYK